MVGAEKDIGFDPCSICFYPTGEYMLMAGSNKELTLWNKEGVRLGTIGEMQDWIWSCAINPGTKTAFAGANNGGLCAYEVDFNKVHGLY
jgi:intraflagellar transport protein 122